MVDQPPANNYLIVGLVHGCVTGQLHDMLQIALARQCAAWFKRWEDQLAVLKCVIVGLVFGCIVSPFPSVFLDMYIYIYIHIYIHNIYN
jgi:hypothetical protein